MESPEKSTGECGIVELESVLQLVLIDSDKGIHIKTAVLIHGAEFLIRKISMEESAICCFTISDFFASSTTWRVSDAG